MKPITAKQRAVLDFCLAFYAENDQLPPCRTIARSFGWASDNAAFQMMAALERRGLIERNALGKFKFRRTTIFKLNNA